MELKQTETIILNHIFSAADFPTEATEVLIGKLPPYAVILPAYFYLLPKAAPSEEDLRYAASLTALTLSAFIHRDVFRQRAFSVNQGILGGDYCLALAFSLLPPSVPKADGIALLKEFCRYNESSLSAEGQNTPFDFGAALGKIAVKALPSSWKETEKQQYKASVTALGQLWAETYTEPEKNHEAAYTSVKTANCGHSFTAELNILLEEYKGARH